MKIGDYVRTRWGYICKIININEFREPSMRYSVEASYLKDIVFIGDEEIIKSSSNIKKLIQVGDYVNGRYVDKYQGKLGNFCELPNGKWEFVEISNKHYLISSIVTKEQFNSMEYKIGDK